LYGVDFRKVKDAKVWHPSVEVYDIYDGRKTWGESIGHVPRENKFSHAANFLTPAVPNLSSRSRARLQFPDPSKAGADGAF